MDCHAYRTAAPSSRGFCSADLIRYASVNGSETRQEYSNCRGTDSQCANLFDCMVKSLCAEKTEFCRRRSLAVLERMAKPSRSPRIASFRARANGNSQQQQLPFISRASPLPPPTTIIRYTVFFRARYRRARYYHGPVSQKAENSKFPLLMTRERPTCRYRYLRCELAAAPANLIAYLRIFHATKLVTHATNPRYQK